MYNLCLLLQINKTEYLICRLVWPKKPFDYMYAEGEKLLRDFPVQATLEFVSDADSDSEDDDYDVDAENNSLTMVTSTTDVVEKK